MDVKLESLIEKIKKEGIDEARRTAQEIKEKAEQEAKIIITEAKAKAKEITEESQDIIGKFRSNTEKSLKQTARDLRLVLKQELIGMCDKILKFRISSELNPKFMKELIERIIDNWSSQKSMPIEVLVSDKDKENLEQLVALGFKDRATKTIEIKVNKSIDSGFRIGIKGQDVYYDFTDEVILESFKEFLNPALHRILDINNG